MNENSPTASTCDVGLIGLGVMGQNLILNMADHGYRVAVYNRTVEVTKKFIREHPPNSFGSLGGSLVKCETLDEFLNAIKKPRVIIVLVKAGRPVDAVCESLIEAGIEPNDIVVDGGNSLWTDTIEREKKYRGKLTFFGSGISGGEEGARFGPSLMPGGDPNAWARLKPIWEAIAAKVDPKTGKPLTGAAPGQPIMEPDAEPCTAYIGPNGAGHYVKMVHNGIEYADMQLIAESYDLLRYGLNASPEQLGDIFAKWNQGDLDSFLIEITADILKQRDPVKGGPLIDVVLDAAGQKGTGKWTAVNALDMGIPAMSITEAVFARAMSSLKDERLAAAETLSGPDPRQIADRLDSREAFIESVRDALYCSKICAYAQGFQLMRAAAAEYGWDLQFGEIARIWRGGCIIRARFLQKITEAYQRNRHLTNLLLDPYFRVQIEQRQHAWRAVLATAMLAGVPCPAFASSLAYYDSYRAATLPANLLQAQRDYFGAHTFERVDQPRGEFFHIDWMHPHRPQIKA